MSALSKDEIRSRGAQAKRLLEELEPVFRDLEDEITRKWLESDTEDHEGHRKLKQGLWALSMLKHNLKNRVEAGNLEEFRMEEDEKVAPFLGAIKWPRKT